MRYDRGDSFPFDFEPNGNPFGSKLREKLSRRSYPIQYERKRKCSFLSVVILRNIAPTSQHYGCKGFKYHCTMVPRDSSITALWFRGVQALLHYGCEGFKQVPQMPKMTFLIWAVAMFGFLKMTVLIYLFIKHTNQA